MNSVLTPILPTKDAEQIRWHDLAGCALALAVAESVKQHAGPVVLITENNLQALQLEDELRFFLADAFPILHFPDYETLPYDHFSPHQDIISERLKALHDIPLLKRGIIITSINTIMQRLPPKNYIEANSFVFKVGDALDSDRFKDKLSRNNYIHVNKVMEHGEFSVRGSIIDVFPMGSDSPFRIDLMDDEIDSIRLFETESQRSTEKTNEIRLLPAREFPFSEEAITRFRQSWRARFAGNPSQCAIYNDVSDSIAPAGIEYYLPLFFEKTQSFAEYLPTDSLVIRYKNTGDHAEEFWHELAKRHEQLNYDVTQPLLPPQTVFIAGNDLFAQLNQFKSVLIAGNDAKEKSGSVHYDCRNLPDLTINHKLKDPLLTLNQFIETQPGRILFCAESAGRREALLELFKDAGIHAKAAASFEQFLKSDAKINIALGLLRHGMQSRQPDITLITETELFAEHIMQRRRRVSSQQDTGVLIRDLAELKIGQAVVHIEHGVGRFLGLQTLDTGGIAAEYLTLEYDNKDKIYVPVTSLDLISRYTGVDEDHAPLDRLGNDRWGKAKRKAIEKIHDVAAELLDVYAKREVRPGHAFNVPEASYHNFVSAFPFEPTADQTQAIEQVMSDMTTAKSMDRLVCGDVGFGKTEVAMRAAFIAAFQGKQVAVLVPTTLLASQHYENFKDRFADFPIQIDLLSRFRSAKEQTQTLENMANGKVDIVIGTHKLLQKDLGFNDLGLIIIDEEHRFGVKQKEILKSLRTEVDILTLTATPIPRTLNMSLSGMRDISIIATPPQKRLSVKTFAFQYNPQIVREAVLREILRGGQVFYLHNKVETIERIKHDIEQLIPEAKVQIAHGQMRERELEKVMSDFYHRRFNVLLCTTIIENGIDIPTANTIIIDRADRFGLAQLHQLRGRVGRSHHQAYAYLIVPDKKAQTSDARKRLEAFLALEDLGAGFSLATHDLEIRGAGEILGDEQSGHMQTIGFSLYMELLDKAVKALKSGKKADLDKPFELGTEINLHISALIPDDYIHDPHTRLTLYKRISAAETTDNLRELQVEMIDRFGLLPDPVKNLFRVTELKLRAHTFGIEKIDVNSKSGRFEFSDTPNISPAKLIKLIQGQPHIYKLEGPQRLRFQKPSDKADVRIALVDEVLTALSA